MVSEINVTPLVDVMLVLLIIFMVTAPMMTQGIDVKLPESSAPAIPTDDERLVVTVTQDRKIYINDNVVEPGGAGVQTGRHYSKPGRSKGSFSAGRRENSIRVCDGSHGNDKAGRN